MTEDRRDLAGCHLRQTGHYNGGSEWFGYSWQVVELPRLSRFDRYERGTRTVVSTWRCDGDDCLSLDEAFERMATPPRLTNEETRVLAAVASEFMSKVDLRAALGNEALPHFTLMTLRDKGQVEWQDGRVRRAVAV